MRDRKIATPTEPHEKRPRHYAQAICAMTSREERCAALDAVPEHLRDWVRLLVQITYAQQRTTMNHNQKRSRP